ncbi:hypothetical protein ACFW04_012144 [Cataglyphis niger]
METLEKLFNSLLRIDFTFGLYDESKIDFLTELPAELSNIVVAMLDWRSLQHVAMVSRSWRCISQCEQTRRRIKLLRRMKMSRRYASIERRERQIFYLIRMDKSDVLTDRTYKKTQITSSPLALKRQGRTNIRV